LLVWEFANGELTIRKRLDGWHLQEIRAVAFRHGGKIAVSCSMDDTLRVWRTDTRHLSLTRQFSFVISVADENKSLLPSPDTLSCKTHSHQEISEPS